MKVVYLLAISVTLVAGAPFFNEEKEGRFSWLCAACNVAVEIIYNSLEQGKPVGDIVDSLTNICLNLDLFTEPVCRGALEITVPTLLYIVNNTNLDRGNFCGVIFMGGNCTLSNEEELEWSIAPSAIPKPLPTEPELPPEGSPRLKVLHLSDIHYDPKYVAGSNTNCSEPLCCRAANGPAESADSAAGLWGEYRNCDLPWRTVEQAVRHIGQQHPDIDYVIWTGDLTPHAGWETSKEQSVSIIQETVRLLKENLPNVPIYPSLGNHEAHPDSTFAPPEITDPDLSTQWLYDEANLQWSVWLPEETSSTIRYGGYYSTLVKPGLRIISMNNNYCYTYNWWLLYKSQDPASTLLWLSRVLQEAEDKGEKVHIISHVPPGNYDCWSIFSREFTKLVSRYESTIAAQFYGHTHNDEYRLFFDVDDAQRPVSVAFIGPSLTTNVNLNPGYKVYNVDGVRPQSTYAVLEHSTWYMNLTEANLLGEADPVWLELYDAREAYDLLSLKPEDLYNLFSRMLENANVFQLYFKNFVKSSDPLMAKGCDIDCKRTILCSIVTNDYRQLSRCDGIKQKLDLHEEF